VVTKDGRMFFSGGRDSNGMWEWKKDSNPVKLASMRYLREYHCMVEVDKPESVIYSIGGNDH